LNPHSIQSVTCVVDCMKIEEAALGAITDQFGEGAASEIAGLMGEGGMPDKDKVMLWFNHDQSKGAVFKLDFVQMKSKAQSLVSDGLLKMGTFLGSGGKGTKCVAPHDVFEMIYKTACYIPRYEALGAELLADVDMDGLEMGLVEVAAPEFTDPWLVQVRIAF
jgi:hypothetical protein